MKRDKELMRLILENVENGKANDENIDGYDSQDILEQKKYLIDEKYLKGNLLLGGEVAIFRMTERGHDFIDEFRNPQNFKEPSVINNINIGKDNNAPIIIGDNNSIEFNKNFDELVNILKSTELKEKDKFIEELHANKNDKNKLKETLLHILTGSAEVITVAPIVASLLSFI
ncbi:MAG: DUF2513 domain-containing protein [Sulfurovum sp.]